MRFIFAASLVVGVIILSVRTSFTQSLIGQSPLKSSTFSNREVDRKNKIDPILLNKILPLYPNVRLHREGENPFFSCVQEIADVRNSNGEKRLVVKVAWTIPGAMVDHGGGDLLIYEDAKDAFPFVKISEMSIPMGNICLIQNCWLQFDDGLLVSLEAKESLQYLKEHGLGFQFYNLARGAVEKSLMVYKNEGREAFLKIVAIPRSQESYIKNVPEHISECEIYPSLVEDFRSSGFKYSSPWEATIFVQLTPTKPGKPIILQVGASGYAEGIDASQVKLLLWDLSENELKDRPEP